MITVHDLKAWKADGRRFTMLTAYDFPTAQILDRAGVPILLVGDSVGNNVLGYEDTLPVTMEEMLHHTRAVARGGARDGGGRPAVPLVPGLLEDGVRNAGRLVKEGGAHAVKLEGPHLDLVHRLVEIGIPVMAHVGLTPQSVHAMGGYRVQGRGEAAHRVAERPSSSRRRARSRSCWRRCRPSSPGRSPGRSIPTIGIGAGPSRRPGAGDQRPRAERSRPKLAKKYADLRG